MTYPYIFHHRIKFIEGNVSIVWGLQDDGNVIMTRAKDVEDARRILKRAGFPIRERESSLPAGS